MKKEKENRTVKNLPYKIVFVNHLFQYIYNTDFIKRTSVQ